MKRHFLMLAGVYSRQAIGGWLMSEKLDGSRAFWDGGVTRGMAAASVPWANTESDHLHAGVIHSTGLWSRYGNVIHAPDWWLDQLPPVMLDGELFAGRGRFQRVRSVVSRLSGGEGWKEITYQVFGMPTIDLIFGNGLIDVPNYLKIVRWAECSGFAQKIQRVIWASASGFDIERAYLKQYVEPNSSVELVKFERLPWIRFEAQAKVAERLASVLSLGGEGLMLRHPTWKWEPHRVKHLLKVKASRIGVGTVVGYTAGRGKLLGMMGALILSLESGVRLELSGFTNLERVLGFVDGCKPGDRLEASFGPSNWSAEHPGSELPAWAEATAFPRGAEVRFKYRELSDDNVPKEACYAR